MEQKVSQGQVSALTPEEHLTGIYLCQVCNRRFSFKEGTLACPNCGATDKDSLVIVYTEPDVERDLMYTKIDWQAGD